MSTTTTTSGSSPAASTTSTTTTTPTSTSTLTSDPARFLHAVAIGGVIACPVLLAMPPRKLDLYTFAILGMGVYCGNHLVRESNGGIGVMGLAGERLGFVRHAGPTSPLPSVREHNDSTAASRDRINIDGLLNPAGSHSRPGHESALERLSLPTERARGLHEALAAEKEAAAARRRRYLDMRRRAHELSHTGWGIGGDLAAGLERAAARALEDARRHGWPEPPGARGGRSAALGRQTDGDDGGGSRHGEALASAVRTAHAFGDDEERWREGEGEGEGGDGDQAGVTGLAKRVWMGGETEGWQERRMREEQDALDVGKGYSDLILDQIWEVWNWDKKKDEDGNWVPKNEADKENKT